MARDPNCKRCAKDLPRTQGEAQSDARNLAPADPDENPPPTFTEVKGPDSVVFRIDLENRLGKGGFGYVYLGSPVLPSGATAADLPDEVAIKFESKKEGLAPYEWQVYRVLRNIHGLPKIYHLGFTENFYYMVMDKLGPSLYAESNKLSKEEVACIAIEAISMLQEMHSKGFVHGDVKPDNFLFSAHSTSGQKKIFLVDLGLASRWRSSTIDHVEYDQRLDSFRGTMRYASVHAHLGKTASRRDDLESLCYTLIFLLRGNLPWQVDRKENKNFFVCRKKIATSIDSLCCPCYCPEPFKLFAEYVASLGFNEEPDYVKCIHMFDDIIPNNEPINTAGAQKLINEAKQNSPNNTPKLPRQNERMGKYATQWITVYGFRPAMKQRYYFDVENKDIELHIENGLEEKLYISSVTSCENCWALIMDGGTGFSGQVHYILEDFFDKPKEQNKWIGDQWKNNFFITALAGMGNGHCLVVMSKGVQYGKQTYRIADFFPSQFIYKKWGEGYFVTSMATSGNKWAVVMSRGGAFSKQVVELDFQYPVDGIQRRWNEGYRITATAATRDQAAFVMSIPKRKLANDAQEARRTSTFPSEHIKENWLSTCYVTSICYGRLVV